MNITIQPTEANKKMLRTMGDVRRPLEAQKAHQAFAEFIMAPVLNVINTEMIIGNLYDEATFDYGTPSTIPLAPLWDIKDDDLFHVWSQARAGGLATSSLTSGDELLVMTQPFTSAISFKIDWLKAARVDTMAALMQRMAQEFIIKREVQAFNVLAASTVQSQFKYRNVDSYQVFRTATQGTLNPQDLSRLFTKFSRINSAWNMGTPVGAANIISKLLVSPETVEKIRNMAFQALNTNNTNGALGGPESMREGIYRSGLNPSFYGMELVVLWDLGIAQRFNQLAAAYTGAIQYEGYNAGAAAVFSPGSEELIFAVDTSRRFLKRLTQNDPETNSTLTVIPDNQFPSRSRSIGFSAEITEGRVAVDGRGSCGLIV